MGSAWTRSPVARLRYTRSRREWTLYWPDRHSRFHLYDLTPPTADVGRSSRRSTEIRRRSSGADRQLPFRERRGTPSASSKRTTSTGTERRFGRRHPQGPPATPRWASRGSRPRWSCTSEGS
ncbi:MAG: DUF3024 domain-containing protein, partial [Actinomycetota bacterium]